MYKPTIGLEIHSELLTESKLFCGCKNGAGSPNTNVCPICLGYPGALPYLNEKAVKSMIKIGLSLGGDISEVIEFDRKHYFYPDIPKGYQISQYPYPIVKNGSLLGINIERIHLEEDTARSSHDQITDGSVIDFNRSGVPLMELVTRPEIHNVNDAKNFAEMLQLTLKYLGVSRARMEHGEMRVEVNISLSKDNKLGTKVEIKNLNSFKALRGAIEYEIKRQTKILESKEDVVQETRGWNENTGKTFSQRIKETSGEYRYMPEPDLPRYKLYEKWNIDELKTEIGQLPWEILEKYKNEYKLKDNIAEQIVKDMRLNSLFSNTIKDISKDNVQTLANFLTSDSIPLIEKYEEDFFEKVTSRVLIDLVNMFKEGEISSRAAKDILKHIAENGGDVKNIVSEKQLLQLSDRKALNTIIDVVLDKNQNIFDEIKNGNDGVKQHLIGLCMKESNGRANPEILQDLVDKR